MGGHLIYQSDIIHISVLKSKSLGDTVDSKPLTFHMLRDVFVAVGSTLSCFSIVAKQRHITYRPLQRKISRSLDFLSANPFSVPVLSEFYMHHQLPEMNWNKIDCISTRRKVGVT